MNKIVVPGMCFQASDRDDAYFLIIGVTSVVEGVPMSTDEQCITCLLTFDGRVVEHDRKIFVTPVSKQTFKFIT